MKKTLQQIRTEIKANKLKIELLSDKIEDFYYSAPKNTAQIIERAKNVKPLQEEKAHLIYINLLLKANYRNVLATKATAIIAEVLKKYDGKKAGEKTLASLYNDLKQYDIGGYFERGIISKISTHLHIYEMKNGYKSGEEIDYYTNIGNPFIDDDNIIHAVPNELLKPSGIYEYIDDIEKRLEEINAAKAEYDRIDTERKKAFLMWKKYAVDGFEI